jgi:Domain of unknown function (DUF4262)
LALDRIRDNIARRGHHLYVVAGGPEPRFAYTIGLSNRLGVELVLAGAFFYLNDEVEDIVNEIVLKLKPSITSEAVRFEVGSYGSFTLRKVDATWSTTLMLGAFDFYQVNHLSALQIVPDEAHWTIDVPNLSEPWSVTSAPAWRWLHEPWTFPVAAKSAAVTNLGALRGERITEVARWEEDEWEIIAGVGPDIPKKELRTVPLGTLVAADESLVPVMSLPIGDGLWRDATSQWHPWRRRAQPADTTHC